MNVQQTPIIVMLMPLAVIHLAHSSVNVNLVSLEMEPLVEVIYIAYSYSRKSMFFIESKQHCLTLYPLDCSDSE